MTLEKNNWTIDLTYLGGSFTIQAFFTQTNGLLEGTSRDNNQERDVFVTGSLVGSTMTIQVVMANGGSTRGSFTCTGPVTGSPQVVNGSFTSVQGTLIGGSTNNLSGTCKVR